VTRAANNHIAHLVRASVARDLVNEFTRDLLTNSSSRDTPNLMISGAISP
jgi:hypothetical protein